MSLPELTSPQIEPIAVPIRVAQELLGGKSHSGVYVALGRGELVAVKDGVKTLVTLESIRRYMSKLPRAVIKPPAPRRPNPDRRRRKR
jgi:hypothetical protein